MVSALALGVDLGGTHSRAAVVELSSGKVLTSVKVTHDDRSPAAVVTSIAEATAEAAKQAGVTGPLPCGVGAAAQLRGDVVAVAPNLGWREVPFGALLAKQLGRPVRVINDLKAAAWGELKVGIARGATDTFTVFVGSGIGSAIIAGGKLVMGSGGVAGELGHLKLVPEGGRLCGCGETGCLEAYAGGVKLEAWMKESGLSGGAAELELQAHAGNAEAKRLWEFAAGNVALVIANQVTVLNPAVVVLGGGVLLHCPKMVERIRQTVFSRAAAVARAGLAVGLAALGDDSGTVGAALLAAEG